MDRETIVQLHKEAAAYYSLANAKVSKTRTVEDIAAEETWYDVCCWLYARIKEAE